MLETVAGVGAASPGVMTVLAYAKINLCLDVLGKRPDGLHNVATVMQTVTLADRLRFSPGPDVDLHCRGM